MPPRSARRRRPGAGAALLLGLTLLATAGAAPPRGGAPGNRTTGTVEPSNQDEYRVKGAFLFKFIRYTTWPASAFESPAAPIVVALYGKNPHLDEVAAVLAGRELHGRALRMERTTSLTGLLDAHVVFVAGPDREGRQAVIRRVAGRPILLVGDEEGFAAAGGTINFFVKGGKIRFAVNTKAMERASLKISSQLLKLARIVGRRGR